MRKLNGITINGEYLGNSVVINAMFRAICTISPSVMREFIQIINKVDSLDEAVKISNFNCVNDSIDIEFGNKKQKGSASLSFAMKDGEPQLSDCKLAVGDEVYNSLSEFQDMLRAKEEKKTKAREKKRQKKLEELKEKRREELLAEKKKQILPQKIATKDENGNEIILEGKAAEEYFKENADRLGEDSDFEILDEDYFTQMAAIEEEVAAQIENEDFEEELNTLEESGEFDYNEEYDDADSLNEDSFEDTVTEEQSTSDDYSNNDTDSFENEDINSSEGEDVYAKLNDSDDSTNSKNHKNLTIDFDDSDEDNDQEFLKEAMDSEGWEASDVTKVNKCTIIAKSIKIEAAGFETDGSVMRPLAPNMPDYCPLGMMQNNPAFQNLNNQFSQTSQGYGDAQSGTENNQQGGLLPQSSVVPQQADNMQGVQPIKEDDDPIRKQMEALQAELEKLKAASGSKKLTTLEEFLKAQRQLEAAREKKRRERFRIIGSREHIRANALDGGIYVAGKRIYKWGDTKTLEN